jgi:polysaccharide export outer membrane protein
MPNFRKLGLRLIPVLVVWALSCGPTTIPHTASHPAEINKTQEPNVSEINKTLATIASNPRPPQGDYRIGPDDLLQITLYNVSEGQSSVTPRTVTLRVSQQGTISLPLIGDVQAKGFTPSELERKLIAEFDNYIHTPEVGVLVKEYRQRISVIGAVQAPGNFELTGPKTVIDVLALAGGVTEKAGSQVHVYRQNAGGRQTHVIDLILMVNHTGLTNDKNASLIDMPLEPGDIINVPHAGMFFVDGAVGKPGSYPLGRRFTLTQAIATAGGVNPELASYSGITILRRKGAGRVDTIVADLSDIQAGTAPDPQLESDDIVVVPTSMAKYVLDRFVGKLISGVSIQSIVGWTAS